jgi:hypothetical protein
VVILLTLILFSDTKHYGQIFMKNYGCLVVDKQTKFDVKFALRKNMDHPMTLKQHSAVLATQ